MKNKYIKEMNSIHASKSFKEEMIEKMNQQKSPTNFFLLTTTKVAFAFACVCLSIVTALSIKNYYDVQNLKEQLFATKKMVDKILYQTDEFNRLMDRNYEKNENQIDPTYYNPFMLGGMGSVGDIFPGTSAKSDNELVKEEDISLKELKQLKEVPIIQVKENVINHKDKIDLMNQLVDVYGKDGYEYKTDKGLLQFITDEFYISIFDKYVELTIDKDKYTFKNEKEAKDVVEKILSDFKLLFPSTYNISVDGNNDNTTMYVSLEDLQANQYDGWKAEDTNSIYFTLDVYKQTVIRLENKKTEINQYSLISYNQALENVKNNKMYAFDGVKEYLNYNRVANVKLQYFFEPQSKSFLPYYEFFIEVDYEKCEKANYLVNDGLKHYGSVYVPAISDKDIKADYGDAVIDLAQ